MDLWAKLISWGPTNAIELNWLLKISDTAGIRAKSQPANGHSIRAWELQSLCYSVSQNYWTANFNNIEVGKGNKFSQTIKSYEKKINNIIGKKKQIVSMLIVIKNNSGKSKFIKSKMIKEVVK